MSISWWMNHDIVVGMHSEIYSLFCNKEKWKSQENEETGIELYWAK